MSQTLIAGANAPLPTDNISVRILSARPIDCAAYRLANNGKVRSDGDMVFYGQKQSDDGKVSFRGHDTDGFFDIDLGAQPAQIDKIAFAFSSDSTLAQLGNIDIQVTKGSQVLLTAQIQADGRSEKAVIIGECYRRQGSWKFRFISQGFNGGLKPLSEHFGVEIADEAPAPPAPSRPPVSTTKPNSSSNLQQPNSQQPNSQQSNSQQPNSANNGSTVNLSKISLTKTQSSINLSKKDDFVKISINLDWNQNLTGTQKPKKGLLSDLFSASQQGIDLDLGAMVQMQNGERILVQALSNIFGKFTQTPYVRLRADDRTGQVAGGEWLDVNGAEWSQIKEVFIFAFIYAGVPNWAQTDGVVTIHVPGQPPIETRLTEGQGSLRFCAIARLVNQSGSINVERINEYFSGHQDMDKGFGWGMSWKKARK